ncbi:helix-turn-helix domain-containing protein [Prauserella muralis]|uniref:Uncharacterized protein n=1 Tax=Prauserella muralis TaxID=588067 RepID=A0A2V4AZ08_9PSEU|nr:helix-turn-helix transcriptional regulator [Prauserella muralis]PXY21160.1 hypothetical protein BAY60_27215 [Prauserella muralis]TWE30249.1 helix-turn-helix protein [Prauserella muralis]
MNRDLFKERRDKQDLVNAEIARRAGISPAYLDNVICGADQPSQRLLRRLERILELPEDALHAGKRTSQGDPSEPPNQPPNEPTHPPKRQDTEQDKKAPRRNHNAAAVA